MKTFKEYTLNEDLGLSGETKNYIEAVYSPKQLEALEIILNGPESLVKLVKTLEKENAKYIKDQKKYMNDKKGEPGYEEKVAQADLDDDLALEKIIKRAIRKL